jgi:hypothetical protein
MRKRSIVSGFAAVVLGCAIAPISSSAAWASANVCSGNPGSNGSTCVVVHGTGLHVDWVDTSMVKNHFDSCAVPTVTLSGQTISTTPICDARELDMGRVTIGRNLPNGSKVCASWSAPDPSNRPCATIHS